MRVLPAQVIVEAPAEVGLSQEPEPEPPAPDVAPLYLYDPASASCNHDTLVVKVAPTGGGFSYPTALTCVLNTK